MEYEILESKMNKCVLEQFEVYHSEIGFDHKAFSKDLMHEIGFIGINLEDLAKSTYIPYDRLKRLLRGVAKYESDEITILAKRLNITL
jgi:predicted transcriptional regulator